MSVLDELQAAVTAAAERVGPSVVGLGRGWGRGSGVVSRTGACSPTRMSCAATRWR